MIFSKFLPFYIMRYEKNLDDIAFSEERREANERAHAEGMQQGLQEGMQQGLQEGLQQGLQQGLEQGLQAQRQTLVKNIENAMRNFRIDLETACKGLGTTVEEYQAAKEELKTDAQKINK